MNKQAKYRVIKLISAISLLVVIVTSVSFAWFREIKVATASNIDFNIVDAKELYIATDDLVWTTEVTDDLADTTLFKCISGNGVEFYCPNYTLNNGTESDSGFTPITNDITSYSLIDEDDYSDYLYVKDVYFKATQDARIFLTSNSFISPKNVEERIIPNINVSRDYIASALRFGFAVKEAGVYVPKLVWIPNSTYELSLSGNNYSFSTEGSVEDTYTFVNGTSTTDLVTVTTNSEETGSVTIDDIIYVWGNISENTYICSLNEGEHEIRMSIWLEGSDREANNIFSSGQISATLDFDSEMPE